MSKLTKKVMNKICLTGAIGNALEAYDLLIFGFMASVLADAFMPDTNAVGGILRLFFVFGVSYFARPLGGVFFGIIADLLGRKQSLIISMTAITLCSVIISILPTSQILGIPPLFFLVLMRVIQGFSYGNEFTNSIIFIYEHAEYKEKYYRSSFAIIGTTLGFLIASAVTLALRSTLSPDEMIRWGWRLAFVFSIFGGIVALYIRKNLPETMVFIRNQSRGSFDIHNIFSGVSYLKEQWKSTFSLMFIVIFGSYLTYFVFLYIPSFMGAMGLLKSSNDLLIMSCISTFIVIFFIPFFGKLADKYSIYKIIFWSIISTMLFGTLYLLSLQSFSFLYIFPLQLMTSISSAALSCCASVAIIRFLPSETRGICSSFVYTLPVVLFGGMGPYLTLLATSAIKGSWSILAVFLPFSLLALTGAFFLKNNESNLRETD